MPKNIETTTKLNEVVSGVASTVDGVNVALKRDETDETSLSQGEKKNQDMKPEKLA